MDEQTKTLNGVINHQTLASVEQILMAKGFTKEQVAQQMQGLGEVAILKTIAKLLSQNPPDKKLLLGETVGYLQQHYSSEQIQAEIATQVESIAVEYLGEIGT